MVGAAEHRVGVLDGVLCVFGRDGVLAHDAAGLAYAEVFGRLGKFAFLAALDVLAQELDHVVGLLAACDFSIRDLLGVEAVDVVGLGHIDGGRAVEVLEESDLLAPHRELAGLAGGKYFAHIELPLEVAGLLAGLVVGVHRLPVDVTEHYEQGSGLHAALAVAVDEGRAGLGCHVTVASAVDIVLGGDFPDAVLGGEVGGCDFAALGVGFDEKGVVEEFHSGFLAHLFGGALEAFEVEGGEAVVAFVAVGGEGSDFSLEGVDCAALLNHPVHELFVEATD